MAKGSKGGRGIASRQLRPAPYPFRKLGQSISGLSLMKCCKAVDKKHWEDAVSYVCMEYPHNAVLLLCSSHEKGCRPYMCGTSCRYSNCLYQYKKAHTKMTALNNVGPVQSTAVNRMDISDLSAQPTEKCEVSELQCPLCRGQVKGWTVIEPARAYLNAKKRTCMQENCSFVGTFKELRKHVRVEHPSAQPQEVDPALEQKWIRFEREQELDDVISTIKSRMPGAMVIGDYVIEGSQFGFGTEEDGEGRERNTDSALEAGFAGNLVSILLLLHALELRGNADLGRRSRQSEGAVGVGRLTPVVGSG
ncbi:hypothetical protein CDL15_Pgr027716 [Punica granatum]|uniref:Uncharacterized protein n=1 Tax=Punica granatum TaxID=22663 RepID=A0A218XJQ8_PUNGR|nr:hypothetical protein CDL15_Pgr027716 [Punica granatum]